MKVKYIRWSTLDQIKEKQLIDAHLYDQVIQEQIRGSIAFSERPKGIELLKMIKAAKISELFVEEFSELGKSAFDILTILTTCEEYNVTVHIQNMDLSSKVAGVLNPAFKILTYILSGMAEQEKEQIKEREAGKLLGSQRQRDVKHQKWIDFINKDVNQKILEYLKEGNYSYKEIKKITEASIETIGKVSYVAKFLNMLPNVRKRRIRRRQ